MNYKLNPMNKSQARKRLTLVLNSGGSIYVTNHAKIELAKDDLFTVDVINVLKNPDSKILNDPEFENGSYRYRVETKFITVVICFTATGLEIIVVTAWDKRNKG